MNPEDYRRIRKRYCEILNYHPVDGGWERPITMSHYQFRQRCHQSGVCWWEWSEFDSEIPSVKEMIDEIEFYDGRVIYKHRNGKPVVEVIQTAKKLTIPCLRIAKYQTKSGKQTVVRQYHIPPGNQYDQRITKSRAESAWKSIQSGMTVSESLKVNQVNWNALVRYTSYEPVRNEKIPKKVRKTIELIEGGMNLSAALGQTKISSRTFWRRTGGIKRLMNDRLSLLDSPTHHPFLEWRISK